MFNNTAQFGRFADICMLKSLAAFIMLPTVPATPTPTVCAVYDEETEALQIIESTWNEVVCCV